MFIQQTFSLFVSYHAYAELMLKISHRQDWQQNGSRAQRCVALFITTRPEENKKISNLLILLTSYFAASKLAENILDVS